MRVKDGHLGRWMGRGLGVGLGIGIGLAIAPTPTHAIDRIIEIRDGSASIIQESGRVWPARVGTFLRIGDLLRPTNGTVIVVRCDNGTVRQVRRIAGVGKVCPDSVARRFSGTGRGEDDFLAFWKRSFNYGSQIIDATPMFRWDSVDGATAYQVFVLAGDTLLWQDTVQDLQARYDGEPLEPGQRYDFIIRAMQDDEQLSLFRLLLRRLSQDEASPIEESVAQLEVASLSDEARALALSQLYSDVADPLLDPPEGSGLVWDAIATLEPIVAAGTETPFTHRLLGDLYLQVGLFEQAQARYEQVLELTQQQDEVATRAAAWVGLANISAARSARWDQLGNEDAIQDAEATAQEYLELALVNYRALGDVDRVERIETEWLPIVSPE